jgi:hypothetical protein
VNRYFGVFIPSRIAVKPVRWLALGEVYDVDGEIVAHPRTIQAMAIRLGCVGRLSRRKKKMIHRLVPSKRATK